MVSELLATEVTWTEWWVSVLDSGKLMAPERGLMEFWFGGRGDLSA